MEQEVIIEVGRGGGGGGLTSSLVHRQLVGQDASDLAEGGHLDAVLLQLTPHVADLLLWVPVGTRRNAQDSQDTTYVHHMHIS